MHIKRFEAPTLLEAVQRVKEELGPDALILSNRSVRRGEKWFGLLSRPLVEVVAAVDRELRGATEDEPRARVAPDQSWRELQISRALVDPIEAEVRALRRSVESLAASLPDAARLAFDLSELQRAAADLRRGVGVGAAEGPEANLAATLLEAGLAPRHAFALAREASQLDTASPAQRRQALRQVLAARLDRHLVPPLCDGLPRADLFVGPTGVGKTTTLAKLAAWGGRDGDAVAVATTDTFRFGAEEQLRSYARTIGAPFHAALSPDALRESRARSRGRHLLVDTAGRSHADGAAISDLVRCRDALGRGARVHLVLPAPTQQTDLARELERYRPLAPDRLVVTKLDESGRLAHVANLLLDGQAPPLAWLTDGQRVPEDLRVPDPEQLAGRVLGATA